MEVDIHRRRRPKLSHGKWRRVASIDLPSGTLGLFSVAVVSVAARTVTALSGQHSTAAVLLFSQQPDTNGLELRQFKVLVI